MHLLLLLLLLLQLLLLTASFSVAAPITPHTQLALPELITAERLRGHYEQLQLIANANGGSRAIATGYNDSAAYVMSQLSAGAPNFQVSVDYLTVGVWTQISNPVLSMLQPVPVSFQLATDFNSIRYGGYVDVETILTDVASYVSNGGCAQADWDGFPAGAIALVEVSLQCELYQKAFLAEDSGAIALLVHQTPGVSGIPGGRVRDVYWKFGDRNAVIPTLGVSQTVGLFIRQSTAEVTVSMTFNAELRFHDTFNVIADTPDGSEDSIVTIGAHLDSVPEGPGLNDNGSGSVSVLEVALQFARSYPSFPSQTNKIRFCWWGAEEIGLLGSRSYLRNLATNFPDLFARIKLNVNHDMLGSPNGQVNVHRASDAPAPLLSPSLSIQTLYEDFYTASGIPYTLTAMVGGSDFLPFLENNIPAGGLNTGASGIKTAAERTVKMPSFSFSL